MKLEPAPLLLEEPSNNAMKKNEKLALQYWTVSPWSFLAPPSPLLPSGPNFFKISLCFGKHIFATEMQCEFPLTQNLFFPIIEAGKC